MMCRCIEWHPHLFIHHIFSLCNMVFKIFLWDLWLWILRTTLITIKGMFMFSITTHHSTILRPSWRWWWQTRKDNSKGKNRLEETWIIIVASKKRIWNSKKVTKGMGLGLWFKVEYFFLGPNDKEYWLGPGENPVRFLWIGPWTSYKFCQCHVLHLVHGFVLGLW
jgi:hypothetical protein